MPRAQEEHVRPPWRFTRIMPELVKLVARENNLRYKRASKQRDSMDPICRIARPGAHSGYGEIRESMGNKQQRMDERAFTKWLDRTEVRGLGNCKVFEARASQHGAIRMQCAMYLAPVWPMHQARFCPLNVPNVATGIAPTPVGLLLPNSHVCPRNLNMRIGTQVENHGRQEFRFPPVIVFKDAEEGLIDKFEEQIEC
jgi:hypothetical protein